MSAPLSVKVRKGCFNWAGADASLQFCIAPWCVHLTELLLLGSLGAAGCAGPCLRLSDLSPRLWTVDSPPSESLAQPLQVEGYCLTLSQVSFTLWRLHLDHSPEADFYYLWSHPWLSAVFKPTQSTIPLFRISTHCHRRTIFHLHLYFSAIVQIGELSAFTTVDC